MELLKWTVTVAALLLWSTGSSAAPMECHFDSRAQCVFQGRHYSLGEVWMDHTCLQCTCLHPVGVGCCQTLQRPVDFPAWCEVKVEAISCKVSLVQKVDPRLPCVPEDSDKDPSHGQVHPHNP